MCINTLSLLSFSRLVSGFSYPDNSCFSWHGQLEHDSQHWDYTDLTDQVCWYLNKRSLCEEFECRNLISILPCIHFYDWCFRAHNMAITACVFSPYARVLVTASVDSEGEYIIHIGWFTPVLVTCRSLKQLKELHGL